MTQAYLEVMILLPSLLGCWCYGYMSADSSGLLLHLQILSALATVLGSREKSNF